jgi:hypothetical protein
LTLSLLFATPAHAQTVDLRDYWPQPAATLQIINQDWAQTSPTFRSVLRRYVKRGQVRGVDVYRLDAYINTGWLSAWEYRDDGTQILEVATELPGSHLVYEVGKEIQWGGVMTLNDVVTRAVHVDVAASTGVTSGYWNWGTQKITFAAFYSSFTTGAGLTFSNVVKLNNFQSWCANSGCSYPSGQNIWTQNYYLAPGVGVVQIDYVSPTTRTDATMPVAETWETP